MNRWNIPDWLEQEVITRDTHCVYCGVEMQQAMPRHGSRKTAATWEHILNDETIITRENIARCCVACNASKGKKQLSKWMESDYCKRKGITKSTVAEIIKRALE